MSLAQVEELIDRVRRGVDSFGFDGLFDEFMEKSQRFSLLHGMYTLSGTPVHLLYTTELKSA